MKTEKMKYAKKIKAIRAYMLLTQEEMAQKIGVSKLTLSNYERGIYDPKVDIWEKILALAPGISFDESGKLKWPDGKDFDYTP